MMKSKLHACRYMNLYKHNNQQRKGKWPKHSTIVKPGCSNTIGVKGRAGNNSIKMTLVDEASCPFHKITYNCKTKEHLHYQYNVTANNAIEIDVSHLLQYMSILANLTSVLKQF